MKLMNTKGQTKKIAEIIIVLVIVFLVVMLARKYFDKGDQMGDEATGIVDDVRDSGLDAITRGDEEKEEDEECPDKDRGYYSIDGSKLSKVFENSDDIERIHEDDLEVIEDYFSGDRNKLEFKNDTLNRNLKKKSSLQKGVLQKYLFCGHDDNSDDCTYEKFRKHADVESIC